MCTKSFPLIRGVTHVECPNIYPTRTSPPRRHPLGLFTRRTRTMDKVRRRRRPTTRTSLRRFSPSPLADRARDATATTTTRLRRWENRVRERSSMTDGVSCSRAQVVVIDAKGHLFGRLASIVSKQLLQGQHVGTYRDVRVGWMMMGWRWACARCDAMGHRRRRAVRGGGGGGCVTARVRCGII